MISTRWFVVVAGTVLVLAGLLLGFSGVSVGSVSCGSALNPDSSAAQAKDLQSEQVAWNLGVKPEAPSSLAAQCAEAAGSRPVLAWVLLGGGTLALAGGLLIRAREPAHHGIHPPA